MKLLFIYNADGSFLSSLLDFGHKIISPETYQCNLCNLTHGNFSENKKWREFKQRTNFEMVFLHRDEFERKYSVKIEYPAILTITEKMDVKITKEELNSFKTPDELISAVEKISVEQLSEVI